MVREEAPSGMRDDAEEAPPLGVPADVDPPDEDDPGGAEQMPGIPTDGEPPSAG